ncbi:MAG: M20/M25/M40 family metallo-hydrolase [Chitinophagia bacterium]|nr:M20/M25/M40 family metallo-hydrolase [Chitinophagia bacterium]NCA29190.1 M20/M25/M40 family metallo-hydrolase [Chitinophagia bacterium]
MSQENNIQNIHTSLLQKEATDLLKKLIAIPSFSKEEDKTALLLTQFFTDRNIKVNTIKNNIWAANLHFDASKPTILLNSHHDTVKPNKGYSIDPFNPLVKEDKLYGLGSNDAGGCLVSLIACFLHFYTMPNLGYNIIFVASAEEEISGHDGIELVLPEIPKIDFGIVGEPTKMEMAIAERGLLVLDVLAMGKAGHAAREEGESALYKILPDIEWFKNYEFEKVSDLLGKIKMSVTVIETDNKQHNVVPSSCKMVVDVRVNELYSFEEVLKIIQDNVQAEVKPRSLRMRSTSIGLDHVLVKAGKDLGKGYYGSVTTSDKALMPFPTLKMGPGDSARSHTADEFIYIKEIEEGILTYIQLLEKIV